VHKKSRSCALSFYGEISIPDPLLTWNTWS